MDDSVNSTEFAKLDSTLVVTLHESHLRDALIVQQVKESILAQLKDGSVQNVVLNLGNVEFVGSIAFLAFLGIRRYPTVDKILLSNLRANVREVFVMCRLLAGANNPAAPFTEVESVADALKYLGE